MNIQSGTATTTLAPANPWALVPPLGNLDAYISAVNRLPLAFMVAFETRDS